MHTRRRGQSGSDKPLTDEPPEWSHADPTAIEARIVELANQGYSPSEIGIKLRDEGVQGTPVPNIKLATGKKLTRILEENDVAADLPEDLRSVMKKAVRIREHVNTHPNDTSNKRALQNTEAKVRRLISYYSGDKIPEDFTYSYQNAKEVLNSSAHTNSASMTGEILVEGNVRGTRQADAESAADSQASNRAPEFGAPGQYSIPEKSLQSLRVLPLTNVAGNLIKGSIPTDSQHLTYERFSTGDSSLYWPSNISAKSFTSKVESFPEVNNTTQCEIIINSSGSSGYEQLELSFWEVRSKHKLDDSCEFIAVVTDDYEITWEKRPSQPMEYDAEIVIMLKNNGVDLEQMLPQLFEDPVPTPERSESLADLVKTLHRIDREKLLVQK